MASKFKQLHLQQSVFIWFTGVKIRVLREHNFVDSDNLSLFVCLSAKYKLLSKVPQMSNHSKFHQLRALCLNDTIRFEPSFVAQRHLWIRKVSYYPPCRRPACADEQDEQYILASCYSDTVEVRERRAGE